MTASPGRIQIEISGRDLRRGETGPAERHFQEVNNRNLAIRTAWNYLGTGISVS
jgi:hypothetical protein